MKVAGLAMAALLAAGCGGVSPSQQATPVAVPNSAGNRYAGIAWDEGQLVVSIGKAEGGASTSLFTMDPSTGTTSPLDVPAPGARCVRFDDYLPSVNGALRWVRKCELPELGLRQLEVLEMTDGGSIQTRTSFETRLSIHGFSASDSLSLGSVGNRICETIVDLNMKVPAGLPVEVEGPGGAFSLAHSPGGEECGGVGIATMPSVRANRGAFLASTLAIGKTGLDRLRQPFDLYVWDPGTTKAKQVALGIRDPTGLAWMDDDTVLVSGSDRDGIRGTWFVELSDAVVSRAFDVAIESIAIREGGEEVAGNLPIDEQRPLESVVVLGSLDH